MTTGHHTDDDFSHFEREIARQRGHGENPDSLSKRMKLTATASVTKPPVHHFGAETKAAIQGNTIKSAWLDEYANSDAIGPSSFYLGTGKINFGGPDLLYRPNDRISLDDVLRAKKTLETASVSYPGGPVMVTNTAQVGGTHYGNPATDVYAFALANDLDALQFNVVKYVTRFRKKDGIKDLRKAIHTLERLIAHEESK